MMLHEKAKKDFEEIPEDVLKSAEMTPLKMVKISLLNISQSSLHLANLLKSLSTNTKTESETKE